MHPRISRTPLALTALALFALLPLLAGCGGSESGSGDRARVDVSVSGASLYEGGAVRTSSTSATASPAYDHLWVKVYRVALLPDAGTAVAPDPAGEGSAYDGESAPALPVGAVAGAPASPVEVDLLNLPGSAGALLLESIPAVPAGTYRKLRLYYTAPKLHVAGAVDNLSASATAHYHLDLHFTGAGLVLNQGTGPDVKVASLEATFVLGSQGLKIQQAGNQVLIRPQVFCSVTKLEYADDDASQIPLPPPPVPDPPPPPPEPAPAAVPVMAEGTVLSTSADGSAQVVTALGNTLTVKWDGGTTWFWADSSYLPSSRIAAVSPSSGSASLQGGASVSVIGTVESAGVLLARSITLSFPERATGNAAPLDPFTPDMSVFILDPYGTFVAPSPSLYEALYDDVYGTADPFGFERLAGATVTVRGYGNGGAISAWWISFGY